MDGPQVVAWRVRQYEGDARHMWGDRDDRTAPRPRATSRALADHGGSSAARRRRRRRSAARRRTPHLDRGWPRIRAKTTARRCVPSSGRLCSRNRASSPASISCSWTNRLHGCRSPCICRRSSWRRRGSTPRSTSRDDSWRDPTGAVGRRRRPGVFARPAQGALRRSSRAASLVRPCRARRDSGAVDAGARRACGEWGPSAPVSEVLPEPPLPRKRDRRRSVVSAYAEFSAW